jgi:hypothetical protein
MRTPARRRSRAFNPAELRVLEELMPRVREGRFIVQPGPGAVVRALNDGASRATVRPCCRVYLRVESKDEL